jgi:4-amino-4-deoxy-L-arabinose transferase-like glycosyltransferase
LQPCLPLLAVFIISVGLLCWNLGARYLWQDEADTAVLAQRMMSYGRPLAYDGYNFISRDFFDLKEEQKLPTGDPAEAVQYYVQRGDFKADTAWTGQPWGQFVVAGISLALFGHDTVPARLPFALAGALTAALLYAVVRRRLESPVAAVAAVALVLGNSFWVMHMRQCRYYALSSLFLLVTLEAYLRWSEGRRWGGPVFIGAAWMWFQMDYGSVWPVLGILGLHAVITRARRIGEIFLVFTGFCAVTAPFCLYYELAGRTEHVAAHWSNAIWSMLFEINQFQLPLAIIPVVLCLLWLKRRDGSNTQSLPLVGLSLAITCVLPIWMALVGPFPFYRYIVPLTTLSAIVAAYGIVETARLLPHAKDVRWLLPSAVAAATLFFLITNLPSWPGGLVFPEERGLKYYLSSVVRPEIRLLIGDLTDRGEDDPNRATVEFLRERLKPGDEIVCSYEDKPLIFYLPNRIRGGISCFRVTDVGKVRFAVYRRSMHDCHTSIYRREYLKSRWQGHIINAPDIAWGNFPDPRFHHTVLLARSVPLEVFERESQ